MTVPGSQSVNTTNITMDPALPTEFYQLVYPWLRQSDWGMNLSRSET